MNVYRFTVGDVEPHWDYMFIYRGLGYKLSAYEFTTKYVFKEGYFILNTGFMCGLFSCNWYIYKFHSGYNGWVCNSFKGITFILSKNEVKKLCRFLPLSIWADMLVNFCESILNSPFAINSPKLTKDMDGVSLATTTARRCNVGRRKWRETRVSRSFRVHCRGGGRLSTRL